MDMGKLPFRTIAPLQLSDRYPGTGFNVRYRTILHNLIAYDVSHVTFIYSVHTQSQIKSYL